MTTQIIDNSTDTLQSAADAIAVTEVQLRDFAVKAAASGDYDSLSVITLWAKTLRAMLNQRDCLPPPLALDVVNNGHAAGDSETSSANARNGKGRRRKRSVSEPVFRRDSDFLVKSARSRKTRADYEHRASSEVLFILSECLAERRATKKLITAEQLLEAYGKRKDGVASYQVYVALGWLVQLGLVKRHARSGYSVPSPNTIVGDVKKAWESLAVK